MGAHPSAWRRAIARASAPGLLAFSCGCNALLGTPDVLILDEPANGLDPEGIAWIRALLRDFAGRGGTVLLSSHLLAEVQATADHLVIIDHGRVIASGTQHALLAGTGQTLEELFLSRTARKDEAA